MPYGESGRTTQAGYRPSGQTLVLKFTTGSVARPALQRGAHQYTTHGQGLSALTAAGNGIRQGSGRQLGRQEAAKMRQENVVQAAYVINCEFQGSTRQQILVPRGIRPPPPAHGRMPSKNLIAQIRIHGTLGGSGNRVPVVCIKRIPRNQCENGIVLSIETRLCAEFRSITPATDTANRPVVAFMYGRWS